MNNSLKKITKYFIVLLGIHFAQNTQAQIVAGGLRYEHKNNNEYDITLRLFRYCFGDSLDYSKIQTQVKCGSINAPINMTRESIRSIRLFSCEHNTSDPCSPQNQTTSQDNLGVEEIIYKGTVNFDSAPFLGLKQCCEIYFESTGIKRYQHNGNTSSNIESGSTFYTQVMLNRCLAPANKMPKGYQYDAILLCINQGANLSLGKYDIGDFDSLSYELIAPMHNAKDSVQFHAPLHAKVPLKVYQLPGEKPNPNAKPPIGFHFDQSSGEAYFTPTKSNSGNSTVVKSTEWRYDSMQKKPVKIGHFFDEIYVTTFNCIPNNPPTIQAKFTHDIYEKDTFCFDIESSDKPFVRPGQPSPPKDTVSLSWNRGIPGATFTVIDKTALYQRAKFCWTPEVGHASPLPYTFLVRARDNACPRAGITERAFHIRVKSRTSDLHNISLSAVKIYPNPSTGQVRISHLNNFNSIEIWSVQGKRLKKMKVEQDQQTFDCSDLIPGTYIVRLEGLKNSLSRILILQ